jgi:hypothetical protein
MDFGMEDDDEEMDFGMEDDETIDMTDASDEEVLTVFKSMGDQDGIIVKKDGDNIHLKDGDNEYMIQLGESEMEEDLYEMEEEIEEEDETIYELEMEDDEFEEEDLYEMEEEEFEEEEELYEMEEMEEGYDSDLDIHLGRKDHGRKSEIPFALRRKMSQGDERLFNRRPFSADRDMDDFEEIMETVKKSIKPKGEGIGKGPKFNYDKKPNMNGGFDVKKKEAFGKGVKASGTGKAKFEYKEGENMDGNNKVVKKSETKEAARTYGNGSKDGSRGLRKGKTNNRNMQFNPFKLSEEKRQEEVTLLREKNEEYKQALDVFRTKLNEVAVFNSNLAYSTRLFTEHSTTKQEKINILRRFDNVQSLKESKNLYRTIKNELSSNGGSNGDQKLTESIERTVNKTVSTGSSANLIESKTYENPQFLRIKDLIGKIK